MELAVETGCTKISRRTCSCRTVEVNVDDYYHELVVQLQLVVDIVCRLKTKVSHFET